MRVQRLSFRYFGLTFPAKDDYEFAEKAADANKLSKDGEFPPHICSGDWKGGVPAADNTTTS